MILILNKGPMQKREMFDEIMEEQRKRTALGEKEVAQIKTQVALLHHEKAARNMPS